MLELKPCPFCGSKAVQFTEGNGRAFGCVGCPNCGGRSGDVRSRPFAKELTILINKHCVDTQVGMSDFIVAKFLCQCLSAFRTAINDQFDMAGKD